jgi:hypothetical protein
MGKRQYKAGTDKNQKGIVENLRALPGVTVETNHNDILVGYNGYTLWYEVKNPYAANKSGQVYESKIRKDQKRIRETYTGHYKIVTKFEEILFDLYEHGMEPF